MDGGARLRREQTVASTEKHGIGLFTIIRGFLFILFAWQGE